VKTLKRARYTHKVCRFYRRTASILLIALLAGAPAAASVCQAWCPDAAAPVPEATATGHHMDPAHEHHTSERASEPIGARESVINRRGSPDCCTTMTQPPTASRAGRADANVVPSSQVTVLVDVSVLAPAAPRYPQ
jgi:hypothetical protein